MGDFWSSGAEVCTSWAPGGSASSAGAPPAPAEAEAKARSRGMEEREAALRDVLGLPRALQHVMGNNYSIQQVRPVLEYPDVARLCLQPLGMQLADVYFWQVEVALGGSDLETQTPGVN